jgi:hypothetical protein
MDQISFQKINPDNGVEAIKRNAKSTLNSVLARMVRLMEIHLKERNTTL